MIEAWNLALDDEAVRRAVASAHARVERSVTAALGGDIAAHRTAAGLLDLKVGLIAARAFAPGRTVEPPPDVAVWLARAASQRSHSA
jgi:hypothetical protein